MLAPELARAAQREFAPERSPDYYPPTRVGMRGSHPGSFEVAHQMRDRRQWDLSGAVSTGESYDLVIVGGGLSGLSAAYYFIREVGRNAKVLVLDNHDDFGGHAKRNEFHYNGRMLALNGGTLNIESWGRYNEHARAVIHDIGIDIDRFLSSNEKNRALYRLLGLTGQATFFDKETWGVDKLVIRRPAGDRSGRERRSWRSSVWRRRRRPRPRWLCGRRPCADAARAACAEGHAPPVRRRSSGLPAGTFVRREEGATRQDELPGFPAQPGEGGRAGALVLPESGHWQLLCRRRLLSGAVRLAGGVAGILRHEPRAEPEGLLADLPGGQHGRQMVLAGPTVHFPDGNATIARLLVRWLIPDAVPARPWRTSAHRTTTTPPSIAPASRPASGSTVRS